MGNAYEFRLVKSSDDVLFAGLTYAPPSQPGTTIGNLDDGIAIIRNAGTKTVDLCEEPVDVIYLAVIGIFNNADADTFTVTVKGFYSPSYSTIEPRITGCYTSGVPPVYDISGGSFVFNGGCYHPLDPLGLVGTESSSWGAIKSIYRD
jgi:hypothetical protein